MGKEFDFEKFKEKKIAVHFKTGKEVKDFCKKMYEQGMKWNDGSSYIKTAYHDECIEEKCYYADGKYSGLDYAKERGYIVLEWSDYMQQKEFTKADLKDGMIVETKERGRYIVLGNMFLNSSGHNRVDGYSDDLKENECYNEKYDVVKVFKIKNNCVRNLKYIFENENLELIWQRTETKHMIAEEM